MKCRNCGMEIQGGRKTFCSSECSEGWHHSTYVGATDGGLALMEFLAGVEDDE